MRAATNSVVIDCFAIFLSSKVRLKDWAEIVKWITPHLPALCTVPEPLASATATAPAPRALSLSTSDLYALLAKIENNGFGVFVAKAAGDATLNSQLVGRALYPAASYFNHR
jgi:hypothetical protein